eukprot:3938111-Rhodomonas_salina.2
MADERLLAESIMSDKTVHHHVLRTALQLLHQHSITALSSILMPDGRFRKFQDLPGSLRSDTAWKPHLYAAVCEAVSCQVDMPQRASEASTSGQRQLKLQTIPAGATLGSATKQSAQYGSAGGWKPSPIVTTRTGSRFAHADLFRAISHVDEVVGSQCHVHFQTPEHALADEPPARWPASKDWELAQYLARSAAVLAVPPDDTAQPVAMQVVHASQAVRSQPVVRLSCAYGRHVTFTVSGYHGLRTYLSAAPVRVQALRLPEWVSRDTCSERQWESFALQRRRWEEAALCLAQAPPPAPPAQPDTTSTVSNKSAITAYFPFAPVADGADLDVARRVTLDRQSETPWSALNCYAAVTVSFDLSSMELRPATVPDSGAWTVAVRHGQAVLRQHPLPFRKNLNALKPVDADLTVDAAHFASLRANGCSEAAVADAVLRQRDLDDQDTAPLTWSRPFTTYLALATEATTLWGCTGLTWDTQYSDFVSVSDLDVELGGTPFATGLQTGLHQSVILLDSFASAQQDQILDALTAQPGLRWVVVARQGSDFRLRTRKLQAVGMHVDEILPGQTLMAPSDGWSNGNIAPIQLKKGCGAYGVWVC